MERRGPGRGRISTTRLCEGLLQRWDPMFFETVDPTRERRMEEILEVLRARFLGPFTAIDLGSGPGALTARVLRRFPRAHVVAVDTDPVLLRVGVEALRRYRKRTAWVLADLRERSWASKLPARRFDAVVSSLALHWLEEDEIRALYRRLRPLLRSGGLLVNGDFLPSIQRKGSGGAAERHRKSERGRAGLQSFKAGWEKWWAALVEEPSMRDVLTERQARMPGKIPPRRTTGPRIPVSLEAHERALRDAGFRDSTVKWQDRGFRVLIGAR